ncbi:lytic transglycosylase domain-containing protein [Paracoccus sp. T5]|uniref:lytic transglycosylase domain-containing protein n=1 Tax=Paracoccus sp. T5 TaxID=3402161 RepID=UPI003AE00D73
MKRPFLSPAAVIATLVLVTTGGVHASTLPDCEALAAQAGAEMGLPEGLLPAVARVESGRSHQGRALAWPWTLNQGGRGSYHPTREEALQRLSQILASGARNVDIGCMQINWRWHRDGFADTGSMMDPVLNTRYAARFLRDLYQRYGNWTTAVAAYHAGDPSGGDAYVGRVAGVMGRAIPQETGPVVASLQGEWVTDPQPLSQPLSALPVPPAPEPPATFVAQGLLIRSGTPLIAVGGGGGDLRQARSPGFGLPPLSRGGRVTASN